jgi:hypothetical protein
MKEDLSGPYPGYGFGALDAFDGYVSYRLLDEQALANEIAEMKEIIDKTAPDLVITHVCRAVPVWRRVRPGRHHPRDGVQLAFPRSLIRAGQAAARAP